MVASPRQAFRTPWWHGLAATLLLSSAAVGLTLVARDAAPAAAPDEELATGLRAEHPRHATLCGYEMPALPTECVLGNPRPPVDFCRIYDSPHAVGLSQAQLTRAVELQPSAFRACMQAWDERRPLDRNQVFVLVHIGRDGRISSFFDFEMVDEAEAKACLATALRGLRFPATDARTKALLTIRYVDRTTTVTATRRGEVRRM